MNATPTTRHTATTAEILNGGPIKTSRERNRKTQFIPVLFVRHTDEVPEVRRRGAVCMDRSGVLFC